MLYVLVGVDPFHRFVHCSYVCQDDTKVDHMACRIVDLRITNYLNKMFYLVPYFLSHLQ